ncbi:transposase [Cystobacter fuscus]|uniref:IS66 family transposase n=1 Tax=Cystobacter fuscus TaxID=43 RepID=UPI0037C01E52
MYAIEDDLPEPHVQEGGATGRCTRAPSGGATEKSAPLVTAIREWAMAQRSQLGSCMRKALEYMLELRNGLTVFLSNAWVPLDNNLVERQMRDMVVGRKNHYGSKSLRGAEVAALFYSLSETAHVRGEDPGRYLLSAALAAIENPGTVTLPSSSD